jgi:hypothetical protein
MSPHDILVNDILAELSVRVNKEFYAYLAVAGLSINGLLFQFLPEKSD